MRLRHINEDKMALINPQQVLQNYPRELAQAISKLPPSLQQEILAEQWYWSDDPSQAEQEDIDWIASFKVDNKPKQYRLTDLLQNKTNLATIARCPLDVVQEINQKWGLQVKPGQVIDPNPSRYKETAQKFTSDTAKPSVMVNGEILCGCGRFIAALLRGDQYLIVWDITAQ